MRYSTPKTTRCSKNNVASEAMAHEHNRAGRKFLLDEIDKVINICRNGERTLMLARLSVASTIETQNVVAVIKTPGKPAEPG